MRLILSSLRALLLYTMVWIGWWVSTTLLFFSNFDFTREPADKFQSRYFFMLYIENEIYLSGMFFLGMFALPTSLIAYFVLLKKFPAISRPKRHGFCIATMFGTAIICLGIIALYMNYYV
jgi:hypothetical protein